MGAEDRKAQKYVPSVIINAGKEKSAVITTHSAPSTGTGTDQAITQVSADTRGKFDALDSDTVAKIHDKKFRPVKETVRLGQPHAQSPSEADQTNPIGQTNPINTPLIPQNLNSALPFKTTQQPQIAGPASTPLQQDQSPTLSQQPLAPDLTLSTREQAVIRQFPVFAPSYEMAPDALETAKSDYQDRLHKAISFNLKPYQNKESPYKTGKISEFIYNTIWSQISAAIKNLGACKEDETEIYQNLPVAILPGHSNELFEENSVCAAFSTDQAIPDIAPAGGQTTPETITAITEFRSEIARALLKARLLQLAALGSEEENFEFLWHYANSMDPRTITFSDEQAPGYRLTYDLGGATLDHANFFKPVFARDKAFFAQYLALAENNSLTAPIKVMIKYSTQKSTGSKTNAGLNYASIILDGTDEIKGITANRKFLSEPEIVKPTPNVTYVNNREDAVLLNNQRAAAIDHLAHMSEALDMANNKIATQQISMANANRQNYEERARTAAAENKLKELEATNIETLKGLLTRTNWLGNVPAKVIKAEIIKLGGDPDKK